VYGGETGIRTLGPREGTTVFETAPFDHSGTSPSAVSIISCGWACKQKLSGIFEILMHMFNQSYACHGNCCLSHARVKVFGFGKLVSI
jgi:hypothetical protein